LETKLNADKRGCGGLAQINYLYLSNPPEFAVYKLSYFFLPAREGEAVEDAFSVEEAFSDSLSIVTISG